MLDHLTDEQNSTLTRVADEYLAALTRPDPYDDAVVAAWLQVAYRICDLPCPGKIIAVDSPYAAFATAERLLGQPLAVQELDGIGGACASWVARYDAYHSLGVLTDSEMSDVFALRAFYRCAWDHILLDECAIVVRRPTLSLDVDGNLHSADGPAVLWGDGHPEYAHHGIWISEQIALRPRTVTRSDYLAISDTEVRRALAERAGWEWIAELLGAEVVDSWQDPATRLEYELLEYPGGKLLRKRSPILQDGTRPWYVEPVHEELRHAQAARKWQATGDDVGACEDDPSLDYDLET